MNNQFIEWLPTIVNVVTTIGAIVSVLKKFKKLDDVDDIKRDLKTIRSQNRELKQKVESAERTTQIILRRQKGIKEDDIDSGNKQ